MVPAHSLFAPVRACVMAAARVMPDVCGVFVSSSAARTIFTPCSFQSMSSPLTHLTNSTGLFFNRATGDPSSRVSCWIRLVIVMICVNHQRSAAFVEDGIWPVAKCGVWVQQRCLTGPVCVHFEHQQVSGVRPFRIIFSVMFGRRIEMRTGTCERRTFTFADVVDVDAVHAGW